MITGVSQPPPPNEFSLLNDYQYDHQYAISNSRNQSQDSHENSSTTSNSYARNRIDEKEKSLSGEYEMLVRTE